MNLCVDYSPKNIIVTFYHEGQPVYNVAFITLYYLQQRLQDDEEAKTSNLSLPS